MDINLLLSKLNKNELLGTRERLILTRIKKIEVVEGGLIEFTSINGSSFYTNENGQIIG